MLFLDMRYFKSCILKNRDNTKFLKNNIHQNKSGFKFSTVHI